MAQRRVFETSLAIAVVVHAVAIALLSRGPASAPPAAPHRQAHEVEIETLFEDTPATPAAPDEAAAAPRRVAMVGRARPGRGAEVAPESLEPGPAPAEPAAVAAASAPGRPGRSAPRLGLDQLGVGADNPLLRAPAGPAPRAHAGNVAPGIARSLAEGAAQREASIGLGPQGPVIGALEAIATAAPGPMNGRAVFAATIDSSGKLLGIDVVDVGEQHAAWLAVARRAESSLAKRKLRKPAGGRAVRLTIEVVAREQLPSGADPGFAVDLAGIPLKKGKGKRSARLSILPLPKPGVVHVETPDGVYDMPWVTAPIPGIGLSGDLADIGAKSRRMVHAHLLSTSVL